MEVLGFTFGMAGMTFGLLGFVLAVNAGAKVDALEAKLRDADSGASS